MSRWVCWFLLVPPAWLLAGWLRELGAPPIDISVGLCLFLAFFADTRALPLLLLGGAVGRALIDEANLPVQILVLGVPIAVLLPLRGLFFGRRWIWQAMAAAACAVVIPKLALLCGRWFDQPSASAVLSIADVLWAALLLPPLLTVASRLPPCAAFAVEEAA